MSQQTPTLQGPTFDPSDPSAVDRYVSRRMAGDEEATFEARMFDDPELFAEVMAAENLRQGLRLAVAEHQRSVVGVGLLAWLVRRRGPLLGALAAVLVLISGGVALVARHGQRMLARQVSELEVRLAEARAARPSNPIVNTVGGEVSAAVGRLVRLVGRRDGGTPEVVAAPGSALVFSLEPPPPFAESYTVELLDVGSIVLWRGEGLALDLEDRLIVTLDAASLAAGEHRFRMVGAGASSELAFFVRR